MFNERIRFHYGPNKISFFHIGVLFYMGFVGCSHSTRELKQCLPVATFDDAVLSRPQNASIIRRQLGHFKNLSTCVSHCCRSSKCDVALFDGTFCYGVFCPTENVCHFEKAREGQRSYQTVLLKDIFAGVDRFLEGRARLGSIHPSNLKLKKLQFSFEEGMNRNKSNIKGGKYRKQGAHQLKRILSAKRNILQERKKRLNDDKCHIRRITNNTTLHSGMDAGKFKSHGKLKGISACARLCCRDQLCDIAVIMTGRCYTVQCYSMTDCQSKPLESKATNIVIAYVYNPRKAFSNESRRSSETDHTKRKEISKKTVVSNPNEGNIGDILGKIRFLNGPSTVTSDMHFSFLQQCALYVEPENVTKPVHGWVTPRYSPVKYLYQAPRSTPPPLGMRSAVPLGGMGTGSLELRADGSFHEWTLENQSPGGSAKLGPGALDKTVLGVRVSSSLGTKAALLRTHPPPGYPGVKGLSYSGSFPVSRLSVKDERFFGVEIDLFAYGTLRARKTELSFVPGVVFTLSVKNPTDKEVDVSFLLNIPLGEQPDTSRRGDNIETKVDVVSSAQCAAMCNEDDRCMAWSYEKDRCSLKDAMPLHAFKAGVTSGVKGQWRLKEEMLTCERPNKFPNSGSTTLLSSNTNKPTFGVTDDFRSVWEAFESSGKLRKRIDSFGFHGTIAVGARLPSGISETLTFILAWYYPYRDHSGKSVGQYYSNLFNSSRDVAEHIRDNLLSNLKDIISWHSNIIPSTPFRTSLRNYGVKSSLPEWLQDHLVNSLSFWRSGFRVADGRWRQWEALDCNDVDSVHNDFQRELPYLIFFPELLENVVRAWARYQHPGGWIQETLQIQWGCHNRTNRLDTPGGRVMADVTPAFLAQFYHLYLWTGNQQVLRDLWPAARKALIWLMRDSTGDSGLPLRKTCTYDIIYQEGYDHTTYNSVMYLLGLRVGQVLADTLGETELAQAIQLAFEYGKEKLDRTLWDEEEGFYHSWWDHEKGSPPWLMADSLYGQVWAYALGLGHLLDPIKMKMHLNKERQLNGTPYGLRVLAQGIKKRTTKTDKNAKQKLRQKWKTRKQEEAVADLGSFSNHISELKDPHFNKLSNFTAKESQLRTKMFYDNDKINRHAAHHFSAIKTSVTKIDMKIQRRKLNGTDKIVDNQFNSTSNSILSVTQKSLQHENCFALEQESKFNSIWMGSDADWTTLNIHLGMDPSKALKQAERALEHYRTKLNDLWNIHGLTAGQGYGVDGQPWCTSHYSFHMVLWHIPLALSGQQFNAIKQILIFEPKLQVPYNLPFFTPFASGTVQATKLKERIKLTVTVTSGRLELKFLAVSKSMFPNKNVEISEGEFVSWEMK